MYIESSASCIRESVNRSVKQFNLLIDGIFSWPFDISCGNGGDDCPFRTCVSIISFVPLGIMLMWLVGGYLDKESRRSNYKLAGWLRRKLVRVINCICSEAYNQDQCLQNSYNKPHRPWRVNVESQGDPERERVEVGLNRRHEGRV